MCAKNHQYQYRHKLSPASMLYDVITGDIFRQIKDPKHALYYLLPPVSAPESTYVSTCYSYPLWTRFCTTITK